MNPFRTSSPPDPYRQPDPPPVEKKPFLERVRKVPGVKTFVGTFSLVIVIITLITLLFVPGILILGAFKKGQLTEVDEKLAPIVSVIAGVFAYFAYRFLRGFFEMTTAMGDELFNYVERRRGK